MLRDAWEDADWKMFHCSSEDISEFTAAVLSYPEITDRSAYALKSFFPRSVQKALNTHMAADQQHGRIQSSKRKMVKEIQEQD